MSVRLACVKHAASVHPEPGSNSHVKKFNNLSCFLPVSHWLRSCSFSFLSEFVFASTGFTVLFGSFSNLLISRISFSEFHPELLSASGFRLPLPAASFKKLLFGIYSGLHYCLFVKVHSVILRTTKRRRRDLNPRAAINDLHPFQGCPFSLLGTSPNSLTIQSLFCY